VLVQCIFIPCSCLISLFVGWILALVLVALELLLWPSIAFILADIVFGDLFLWMMNWQIEASVGFDPVAVMSQFLYLSH